MDALRRLFGHPRILPLTALLLRSRCVRPSAAFTLRELARVHDTRVYRLPDSPLRVTIRHRTPDVVTLGEIFHDGDYLPGPEAERALNEVHQIVDLGANIGLFGAFAAARWPRARIVGYEPDPANAAVHARTIAINGLGDRWALVTAAAGARDGEASFQAGQASLSRLAGAGERGAITVPVHDVLGRCASADLLKMDIEGGEWAILGDPRFRAFPPRVVVLEYHPWRCPEPEPRAAAIAALQDAAMTVLPITHHAGDFGMLWAWRR